MKMSSSLLSSTSSFDDASPSASSGTRGRARCCHVCCTRMRGTRCSLPGTMHDTCSDLPRASAGQSVRVIRVAAAVSAHGFSGSPGDNEHPRGRNSPVLPYVAFCSSLSSRYRPKVKCRKSRMRDARLIEHFRRYDIQLPFSCEYFAVRRILFISFSRENVTIGLGRNRSSVTKALASRMKMNGRTSRRRRKITAV